MSHTLLVLWAWSDEEADFTGQVSDQDKRDAQRLGACLARQGCVPDEVRCAPDSASIEIAEKACKAAGLGADRIHVDPRLASCTADDMECTFADLPEQALRTLIVGADGVAFWLRRTFPKIAYQQGCLAWITGLDSWSELSAGAAQCQVVLPADLPRGFPYPDKDSDEMRPRPAYYYRQSGVIPYRIDSDHLEVLVVSSSKRRRWIVPKGVHTPGLTAQASAANEALEEAGVVGVVDDLVVGEYQVDKWDGTCTVTVFPMQVTEVLPEEQWEERHRGRQWLSVARATELVENEDLKRLIARLPELLDDHRKAASDES